MPSCVVATPASDRGDGAARPGAWVQENLLDDSRLVAPRVAEADRRAEDEADSAIAPTRAAAIIVVFNHGDGQLVRDESLGDSQEA